jgi:hypothetical protein
MTSVTKLAKMGRIARKPTHPMTIPAIAAQAVSVAASTPVCKRVARRA